MFPGIRLVHPRITRSGRLVKGGAYLSVPHVRVVPPRVTKTGKLVRGGIRYYKTIKL